jgi:hypothetical protein
MAGVRVAWAARIRDRHSERGGDKPEMVRRLAASVGPKGGKGMQDRVIYSTKNVAISPRLRRRLIANNTVTIVVTADRFRIDSCGSGLLDRPRTIDVQLADLAAFAVVPAAFGQTMGRATFDAELLIAYRVGDKTKRRRVFANAQDPAFQRVLDRLAANCPNASLLNVAPTEAYRRIGVVSPVTTFRIVFGVLFGIPVLIALLAVLDALAKS